MNRTVLVSARRRGIAAARAAIPALVLLVLAAPTRAEEKPTVKVVQPSAGNVTETIDLPGSLEAFEVAPLHANITGYLGRIAVDLGDVVKKGDVLAELHVPEMEPELKTKEAEKAAALARLSRSQADVELKAVTLKRLEQLKKSEPGLVPDQDLDVARAEVAVASSKVKVAQADILLADSRIARLMTLMEYTRIRAPFDGVVTRRYAHTGILVEGGDTSRMPIVEVVRVDKLRLAIEIPEIAVPHVKVGQGVRIVLDALPGDELKGKVSRLSGALNPTTRNRRAEIDLDSRNGLLVPGMFATVRLDLRSIAGALSLPAKAIRKIGGHDSVYVVKDGKLEAVRVGILKDTGDWIVVTGDLTAETPVVTSLPRLTRVGDAVETQKDASIKPKPAGGAK